MIRSFLHLHLRRAGPATELILNTARQQWRLVVVNLGSSLLEAASEGAALGVVFMAVQVLSSTQPINWSTNPLVGSQPALVALLTGLPRIPLFLGLLGLSVLLQVMQSVSRYALMVSAGYMAARSRGVITSRIHSQILSLSYTCASGYRVGDLTDLLGLGPEAVRMAIELNSQLLLNVLLISVYLAVLMALSPWLLLMAVLLALAIAWIQRMLLPRIRHTAYAVSGDLQQIASQVTEHIQGLRLLHSTGTLASADRLVLGRMGQLEQILRHQSRLVEMISPISQALPVIAIAALGGTSLIVFGDKSSGVLPSLVTFVLALQRLNMRIGSIARIFTGFSENSGRLRRLDNFLRVSDKEFHRVGGIPFSHLSSGIALDNVSLVYPASDSHALHGVSFEIHKGQTIALVGPSGAGKSSIADLLIGIQQPTSGRILVDGIPLSEMDLATWQRQLGVVSQDTFLFNASIADNISFGLKSPDWHLIVEAAKSAQIHDFIESLPEGYETLIGERGYRLSGGQRQRLSLARAVIRNPTLLILDEATSALDSKLEDQVRMALESMNPSTSKIVIAHRLSTIVDADQIIVLQNGMIEQIGTHSDLLQETSGLYRSLWIYQQGVASTASK